MPLPFVIVEVPAQDRAAPETAALIAACTAGLSGGRCALTQARDDVPASAIAIVSWRDREYLNASVEVARARPSADAWRSEDLRFKPEDQRVERFRSLGLAIAALVRGPLPDPSNNQTESSKPEARSKEGPARALVAPPSGGAKRVAAPGEAPTRAPRAPAQASLSNRGAEAWLGAGASALYDPELAAWRAGPVVTGTLGARHFPVFVNIFGSYAAGLPRSGVFLSWSVFGAGPGARLPLSPTLELSGVAGGLLVHTSAHASEPGRTSQRSVWVPGVSLTVALGFRASNSLLLSLAGEARQLAGRVPIREHNQPAAVVGKTTLGAQLQVSLRLF